MRKYQVTIMIDGHWGTQRIEKIIITANDDEAEQLAEEFLDTIETRHSENSWGAYEEAYIQDIVKIA